MQQYHPDASDYFKSLDAVYYFWGQLAHQEVALEAQKPRTRKEMDILVGDKIISSPRDHWNNGYSKGKNNRTSHKGLYPSYKVEEEVRIAKMPTYPESDRNNHTGS